MNKATELYRHHLWAGRTLLTLLILAMLLLITRALLPLTIGYGAERWLRQQGVETQIENVDIGIYDGKFILFNASGRDSTGQTLRIDRVALYWDWSPLRKQTVYVEAIELEGIDLDTFQYSDGFVIAGIRINLSESTVEPTTETPAGQEPVAWGASLKRVVLSDLNTCYARSAGSITDEAAASSLYYCIRLDRLQWEGDVGFNRDSDDFAADDVPLAIEGDFQMKNLVITDRLLDKTALSIADIEIDTLVFDSLASFGFDELTVENVRAMQGAAGMEGYDASVSEIHIETARIEQMSSLSIQSLSIENPAAAYTVDAQGRTNIDPWLPAAQKTTEPVSGVEPEQDGDDRFEVALQDITVSGSHLCYHDKREPLDYCLMNDSLEWKGDIRYGQVDKPLPLTVSGTLAVRTLKLNNRGLKRDLVHFDRLMLVDVTSSGLDATLAQAGISNLQLMQMQPGEDEHAAGFDTLDMESIDYEHESSVSVDSILLAGLHADVRKEKSGVMSFDEWLPGHPVKEESPAGDNAAGKTTDNGDPMTIRIGSISIKDTKSLTYLDRTTAPEMDVGLQKLNLEIQDINSSKPEQQSPLELNAKTSRHGTIDIKGTIKPFDEKVSFDATGKINGLDLRAISPLTQQQIGHIIRSGQLDADLKLFAKNGELDSNIALTLQHFHLTPKSEEDAQALNKTFGMPVNQSLKLLRAKDDSISLDIPVTGDLSNPSFDPKDAIISATTKATTFTLITFYTPYGLAYAGGNILFDLATAMRFEPVQFEAGNGELNSAAIEQLEKLAKLMKERPQIRLTFCGKTGRADLDALFPPAGKKQKQEQPEEEAKAAPTPGQLEQLQVLADTRQQNAKNYLVEQQQIEHNRIILCAPEYDGSDEALSGVEINL